MNNFNKILEELTKGLVQTNVAIPAIAATVMAISAIIKGVTGSGPTPAELADLIEAQVKANGTALDEDIARMRAMIEA